MSLYPRPHSRRALAGVAVLTTTVMTVGPAAYADTVTNNITAGGNDTTTVGSTTTVSYSLNATNDPGEPGNSPKCNATADAPVRVTVSTPTVNGTSFTGLPATLSFTDCSSAKSVTMGASKAGDYLVSAATGAANVTTTAAQFTLKVKAATTDTTGPVLALPTDQTVEATSNNGAAFSYTATAYDEGDKASTAVTCTPASGSDDARLNLPRPAH